MCVGYFLTANILRGVYPKTSEPKIYIDISSIESLKEASMDLNLVLGAGMSLTEMMTECKQRAQSNANFKYLDEFYKHLDLIAHVPVRNIGTIGGNLAMKNAHHEFPSDIFLLLETVQATVCILSNTLEKKDLSMQDFLKEDLRNKIILDVKLPPLSATYHIRTYKIMPRAQNAHAIVNAGFCFKLDSANKVESANITFGNISARFIRANDTEGVLRGQELFADETLQKALLYPRAILSLCPSANQRYISGGTLIDRGISRGTQAFDTDKTLWPLNQPVPKLEATIQCSGEAKFSCDVVMPSRAVHVAFVLSTICTGEIVAFDESEAMFRLLKVLLRRGAAFESGACGLRTVYNICTGEIVAFDESEAMKLPGVVAFFTAKDIPGKNTFTPTDVPWQESEEEILAAKKISYYGQPIALVAAVTQRLALEAAELVKVTYNKSDAKPVLSIKDALAAPDKDRRIREEVSVKAKNKGSDVQHTIKGNFTMGSQYHYTMETQCAYVTSTEQGLKVRSSTQWMDLVHVAVAQSMGLKENQ
ncbi:aldehyde oxidase and xanthine dehydrogenase, a/b hammerhead domain-containing protein [Phthorimaea operculella]|nr:aldehyde oxidase and xanthine dehydrogenase, a/b hammerhead domain-containing protein [Phthorimaea operculella]